MSKLKIDWHKYIISDLNTNKEGKILSVSKDGFQIVADFEGRQKVVSLTFNKEGFKSNGIHRNGTRFSDKGYDIEGYDIYGYNKELYDRNGFNRSGYNSEGYDQLGYDKNGLNKDGYDKDGYKNNFNIKGLDRDGYDSTGFKNGYNRSGFNQSGINKITGNIFDEGGFDINGNEIIQPKSIEGIWEEGWTVDLHTNSSSFSQDGHFYNHRSLVGEYLYKIKYYNDYEHFEELIEIICGFIKIKYLGKIDGMIFVPPSKERDIQPVEKIAKEISKKLHIPLFNCLIKKRQTPAVKELLPESAKILLENIFEVRNVQTIKDKNILLFDDIYGFGNTLTEITKTIRNNSEVRSIFILTITKTRNGGLTGNIEEINPNNHSQVLEIPF